MLSRIFPRQFDNNYQGYWVGLGLFVLVIGLKATQGIGSLFNTRETAVRADGLPLDLYSAAAADAVVGLFALAGFYLLIVPLFGVIALVRYRSMIPLLFAFLIFIQLSARAILTMNPIQRLTDPELGFAGHPIGFWVNLAILAVTVIGFILSVLRRSSAREAAAMGVAR